MASGTTSAQPRGAVKTCDELYKIIVPLNAELTKRAVEVVEKFVKKALIPKMKELDGLFDVLYCDIYHGGSYYDGLRITEPTEFDLDVKLKMPFRGNLMKLEFGNGTSIPFGFAKYYCISSPENVTTSTKMTENRKKVFFKFFEENTFVLLPLKVRDWFRSVVDKAITYYACNPFYCSQKKLTVRKFKWGPYSPAATLKIKVDNDLEVDIDLVPVFTNGEEMLVAKTYRCEQYQKVWRLSYPSVERDHLKSQSCAKKVIRLLKWFRDSCKDLNWVSSYYLKTAVMLEIKKNEGHWSDKQLGEKLEEILKMLQQYFQRRRLPSLHDARLNLLHLISPDTLSNAEGRLRKFLRTDGSVEIVDKFVALINKSGVQITAESRNVQQSEDLGENRGYSNSEVEEIFEEVFPYKHMEDEVSDDVASEPLCTLV